MRFFRGYYLFFVFALPLIPSYLGIRLGFGLINFQRILLGPLVLLVILRVFSKTDSYSRLKKSFVFNRKLCILFFCFLLLRLFSAILSENVDLSLKTVLYEAIVYPALFAATVIYVDSDRRRLVLIKVLASSAVIVAVLALLERIGEQNLFLSFANSGDLGDDFLSQALSSKVRGEYRSQGTFYNPLSLANYLVMIFPLIIFLRQKPILLGRFRLISIVLILAAVWFTGSRAAVLVGGLSLLALAMAYAVQLAKSRFPVNKSIGVISLFALVLVPLFAIYLVAPLILGGTEDETSSTMARYSQIALGLGSIVEHPYLGIGPRLASSVAGVSVNEERVSVDNYYLSLAVESGLIALLVLCFAIFLAAKKSHNFASDKNSFDLRVIKWVIINFSIFLLISSLYDEIFPFFVIFSAILCASYQARSKFK